jgi:hypothetical protein
MASRKQTSMVDGQNSDGGMKDSLESQTPSQKDPYRAKASEFPVKKISAAHGQSEDAPNEQDQLVPWDGNKESPRHVEIPSEGESDSMSSRQSAVAGNFKVSRNAGESGVAPVSVSITEGVDCSTGRITGGKLTRVDSVFEDKVSIG